MLYVSELAKGETDVDASADRRIKDVDIDRRSEIVEEPKLAGSWSCSGMKDRPGIFQPFHAFMYASSTPTHQPCPVWQACGNGHW